MVGLKEPLKQGPILKKKKKKKFFLHMFKYVFIFVSCLVYYVCIYEGRSRPTTIVTYVWIIRSAKDH